MPIHIRYGDKNGVLSQQFDISPVIPRAMRYWQASYTAIVPVFGVLYRLIATILGRTSTVQQGE